MESKVIWKRDENGNMKMSMDIPKNIYSQLSKEQINQLAENEIAKYKMIEKSIFGGL